MQFNVSSLVESTESSKHKLQQRNKPAFTLNPQFTHVDFIYEFQWAGYQFPVPVGGMNGITIISQHSGVASLRRLPD